MPIWWWLIAFFWLVFDAVFLGARHGGSAAAVGLSMAYLGYAIGEVRRG